MKSLGVESGIVEAGGTSRSSAGRGGGPGSRPPASQEGRHPSHHRPGGRDSAATSGDYERLPCTAAGVTTISWTCAPGSPPTGGLSPHVIERRALRTPITAIFVMGLDGIREFLGRHGEIDVIPVDEAMKLYVSERLHKR